MVGSSVDLSGEVERRRALARPLAEGGPWVRWRDEAVDEARSGGRPAGPLESVLVAVKDLVAVAGLPLGAGNRALGEGPPSPADAAIVDRLRALGAVILGTVALHELAFGLTGINDQVGFPTNPADHGVERIPGGSSSGSAVAVADGSCDLAIGTDTGGSVRVPAALCGVVGLKPRHGLYPTHGVYPLSPSLDHLGLLARTVEDVAAAHQALVGEAATPPPVPLGRLGVDRAALEAATPVVADTVDRVLRRLADAGVDLVDVAWPDAIRSREVSTTIMFAEAAEANRGLLDRADAGDEGFISADVLARLRHGATIGDTERRAAVAEGRAITAEVQATLATVDSVVGPTVAVTAPTVAQARLDPNLPMLLVTNTRLANLTGLPALSVPVPSDSSNLPVGLQVMAATEGQALGVGLAVQGLPAW
jgi:Asp-tRNA(Asn)/Glu-tRNA(Gln) amidotransferase A subunit family amidase